MVRVLQDEHRCIPRACRKKTKTKFNNKIKAPMVDTICGPTPCSFKNTYPLDLLTFDRLTKLIAVA